MDWMNWKTWTTVAVVIVALFAIYTFASPEPQPEPAARPRAERRGRATTTNPTAPPGVDPIDLAALEGEPGSFRSDRNIFAFKELPPPPPPPPPPAPPDKDKDGVPDFRDNCVSKYNPDQTDVDQNGIGAACQEGAEVPPPPPPPPVPQPPPFTYRYIGTFGSASNPIATFAKDDEVINVRTGDVIGGRFILRGIGIESVEIGFVGFPPDRTQRIPLGQ